VNELKFDVVLHLAGEQSVPNYMAVRLSEAERHILITTEQTRQQLDVLACMFPDRKDFIRSVEVPSADYPEIHRRLESIDGLEGKTVGVNITGGTKPMSTAALDFCRERHYVPFYLDTGNRKIHIFEGAFPQLEMPKVFHSVEEFLKLSGYFVTRRGKTAADISGERRDLVKLFWQNKDFVRRPIRYFSDATDKRYQSQKGCPPDCFHDACDWLLCGKGKKERELAEKWESLFPPRRSDWRIAARFGAGEWFEEWLLLQFAESRCSEDFVDLRSGLSATFAQSNLNRDAQEIDVAYTDGYTLTLIECKAGRVFQEHIQKLENIRSKIGGSMGRGIICAINYQDEEDIVVQRVKNGGISLVTGDEALRMLPTRHDLVRPRRCYQYGNDYQR